MDPWCCDNVKGLDGLEGVGNYPRPFILSGAIDYLSLKSRTFLDNPQIHFRKSESSIKWGSLVLMDPGAGTRYSRIGLQIYKIIQSDLSERTHLWNDGTLERKITHE